MSGEMVFSDIKISFFDVLKETKAALFCVFVLLLQIVEN